MSRIARFLIPELLLLIYAVIVLFPLVLIIGNAFRTNHEIYTLPFSLPRIWKLDNIAKVLNSPGFLRYYLNSAKVTAMTVVLVLAAGSLAANALARYTFKCSGLIYTFFILGLILPSRLSIIPLFVLIRDIGLMNTHLALILTYTAAGLPFAIFVLTSYFGILAKDLEDAARIDGCNDLQVFLKILLPASTPALGTVTIFNSVSTWNDFFTALILISSPTKMTLQYGLLHFQAEHYSDWSMIFAGVVLTMLPMIVLYLIMSKQFIAGLTSGALKE
jgi:raffinose/stachyose/melibiose transport system permease protein